MSSWLARSLANSLLIDGDGDRENDVVSDPTSPRSHQPEDNNDNAVVGSEQEGEGDGNGEGQGHGHGHGHGHGRGVKEDLDEIKETLTRQFWGMASFLAPPPSDSHPSSSPPPDSHPSSPPSRSDPNSLSPNQRQFHVEDDAIRHQSRRDYSNAEQGRLHADDPGPIGSDSELDREQEMEEYAFERAVGITEEVLSFAMNIAMHPETWLDFPIDEEDDPQDFNMSDAQEDHALVIERLIPRLAALRIELCPCHMSESYFWKVYFVLLHSRLNKQNAAVLSTPQVMEARALWMQELHKQIKPEFEYFTRSTAYSRGNVQHDDFAPSLLDDACSDDITPRTHGSETTSLSMLADHETVKHTVESSETHCVDKSVIEENPIIKTTNKDLKYSRSSHIIIQDYDDDEVDWPEEDSELGGMTLPIVNEEDISFSDLEDDDFGIKPVACNNTSSKVV